MRTVAGGGGGGGGGGAEGLNQRLSVVINYKDPNIHKLP